MSRGIASVRRQIEQAPSTFMDDLNRSIIEFYSDYCWKMTEFWFRWHTFWFQMMHENNKED